MTWAGAIKKKKIRQQHETEPTKITELRHIIKEMNNRKQYSNKSEQSTKKKTYK